MRIGIEAQRIFRKKKHGMDIVALEFIRALQTIDTVNEYYIFIKDDVDHCLNETKNFKIILVSGKTYIDWEQFSLPKAVKKYKVELLHCTSNTAPLYINVPLVLLLHDIIYIEENPLASNTATWYQKMGNLYRKLIVPILVKKAVNISTVSNFEKNNIAKHFPTHIEKVRTIYNAVSPHFFNKHQETEINEIKKKYNLPKKYLLFFANTDPKKNTPNTLMGYLNYVKKTDNPLPIVLLDIKEDCLRNLIPNFDEFKHHFILPGYIFNKELPQVFNGAQLFLYTSIRESFGIPLLEGMASGTPVLATNTSSLPEIAQDAAIFIDPYDIENMGDKIISLLENPIQREAMIQKGINRAEQFSWTKSAKQYLELYHQTLTT